MWTGLYSAAIKITGKPAYPIQVKHCAVSQSPINIDGVDRKCTIPEISWISGDVWSKDRIDFSQSIFQHSVINVALNEHVQMLASLEDLLLIIHNAVNLSNVVTYMRNQSSNSPVLNYRFIPFMSSVSAVMFSA